MQGELSTLSRWLQGHQGKVSAWQRWWGVNGAGLGETQVKRRRVNLGFSRKVVVSKVHDSQCVHPWARRAVLACDLNDCENNLSHLTLLCGYH